MNIKFNRYKLIIIATLKAINTELKLWAQAIHAVKRY